VKPNEEPEPRLEEQQEVKPTGQPEPEQVKEQERMKKRSG
jgi:hypothetical protein